MAFTKKQIRFALLLFEKTLSASQTIRILGYPMRTSLYRWVRRYRVMRGSVHDKNPGKKSWRLGVEGSNYYVEPQVEIMYGHMNNFNEDDAFVFKQK